jgi:hypothetical protein
MNHTNLLRELPLQAILGSIAPIAQLAASKLRPLRSVHRKWRICEQLAGLNMFIASMGELCPADKVYAEVTEEAIRDRSALLRQLATTGDSGRMHPLLARLTVQRLLLVCPANSPAGWALHWAFYTTFIATIFCTARVIVHVNYLPPSVLIPALAITSMLTVFARLAVFGVENQRFSPTVGKSRSERPR